MEFHAKLIFFQVEARASRPPPSYAPDWFHLVHLCSLDMLLESDGNFGEVINGTDIRPDSMHLS